MNHQQPGYILFITFSILALCAGLISAFMVKGITHKRLTLTLLEQNQLGQFAFSTPALAQSFLSFSAEQMKSVTNQNESNEQNQAAANSKGGEDQNVAAQGFAKLLLEKVLPVVNKTQTFRLKEIDKDLPELVNLTFFCESGKININGLYDQTNKKFHGEGVQGADFKVFTKWIFDRIAVITEKPSLFGAFVEHLKQRTTPFNDVTELLAIKEFADCFGQAVFYEQSNLQKEDNKTAAKIFLTDIFTVVSEHDTIQPWLLSPSVCALLDIAQTNSQQLGLEKKEDKKFDTASFKVQADWLKDWDALLKPIYGVAFDKIPEQVRFMFAKQFSVTVFSIMVTVVKQVIDGENNMIVRIFAILKEKKLPDNSITYDVIKVYQV